MDKKPILSIEYLMFDFIKYTAAVPGLIWFRPKTIYLDETTRETLKKGSLLISNHISWTDPVFIMLSIWYRRPRFVCTNELLANKFLDFLFRKGFLCIPIDRYNFSMSNFKDIGAHLKDGELVTMFPEGHVNLDASVTKTFKTGMVLIAARSGAPIVPIYIKRRQKWYERLICAVGKPVDVRSMSEGPLPTMPELEKISEYLQARETELAEICEK